MKHLKTLCKLFTLLSSCFVFGQAGYTTVEITAIVTASSAAEGDIYRDSDKDIYYMGLTSGSLRIVSDFKPKTVVNELIFDGEDDVVLTNDNFYYVSLLVDTNWKVIRYNKTDVNLEEEKTELTNPSQTVQPMTLAECVALF